MRAIYIYSILILIYVTACTRHTEKETGKFMSNSVLVINVPTHFDKELVVDSIFLGYQFIPLETKEECLIADPQKIFIYNDKKIFIQDFNNSLFEFGMDGKFQRKIGKKGRGPGEYIQLAGFDVDSIGNIYILDYYKIIKYSPEGIFESSTNLNLSSKTFNCWPEQFVKLPKGYYLWSGSLAIEENDENKYFAMYKVSDDFEIKEKYFPLTHKIMNSFSRFRGYNAQFNIDPIFGNDTIYTITTKGVVPKYFIDFGKRALLNDIPNEYSSLSKFKSKIAHDYSFSPRRFTETKDWIYFIFSYNFKNYNVFYSKNHNRAFVSELFPTSPPNTSIVKWIDSNWNDSLIVLLEPNDIISRFSNNTIDGFVIDKTVTETLKDKKITDNPVLMICSMKKD